MKKIIFLLSIITLVFTSCSNDDVVSSVSESSQPVLVKKIVTTNLANNSIINSTEFQYNGNKISKSSDQNGYSTIYTYAGDLISNIKIVDATNALKFEYLYVYQNNVLIESKYISYIDNLSEKRSYVYNTNGTVDFVYYRGDLIAQNTLCESGSITIQNEEVTGIVMQDFINSSNGRSTTNTYDNNNNPLKNVIGLNKLNVELDRGGGSFKNPISTSSNYSSNMLITTNFTYTYNSNGYPISSTMVRSDGLNYKSTYSY